MKIGKCIIVKTTLKRLFAGDPVWKVNVKTRLIRHNRARGRHQITAVSKSSETAEQMGNNKIGKELGMDGDSDYA